MHIYSEIQTDLSRIDQRIQSHIFHVVIDSIKSSADIYTYNKELYKAWSLSEGRQRSSTEDLVESNADSHIERTPAENEMDAKEVEIKELKRQVEQGKQMQQRLEQEKQEMEQQMEVERLEVRLRMNQEQNQKEETIEASEKLAGARGKKRKGAN